MKHMKMLIPGPMAQPTRRSFLLGLGAVTASTTALNGRELSPRALAVSLPDILHVPDRVAVCCDGRSGQLNLTRSGNRWGAHDVEVDTELREVKSGAELAIFVTGSNTALTRIRIRWHGGFQSGWRYLGDQWERSYGDLEFRGLAGDRPMPWYFIATDGSVTSACGVKTGASAICYWQVDAAGINLWLDVSNGGSGVLLSGRRLLAATVVMCTGHASESCFDVAKAFCHKMCERPLLPAKPIYGSNNWYYMYGENVSAQASLRDAELLPSVPTSLRQV